MYFNLIYCTSAHTQLRAQAQVLKKAVLDEQAKEAQLREQLQQNGTSLRRTEQEVDSLGFRNKQLESRVSQLQQELTKRDHTSKKKDLNRRIGLLGGSGKQEPPNEAANTNVAQEALIFEELQKKIMENAELTLLVCNMVAFTHTFAFRYVTPPADR